MPAMPLLTLQEAADLLRVSPRTLEREAANGRLAIIRIRSNRRIAQEELDRYIAAQRESGKPVSADKPIAALVTEALTKIHSRQAQPATTRRRSKLRRAVHGNKR